VTLPRELISTWPARDGIGWRRARDLKSGDMIMLPGDKYATDIIDIVSAPEDARILFLGGADEMAVQGSHLFNVVGHLPC
jgi:hypothetical protein